MVGLHDHPRRTKEWRHCFVCPMGINHAEVSAFLEIFGEILCRRASDGGRELWVCIGRWKIRNGRDQRRQKHKICLVLVFIAGNSRHRDYP